jgi:hypothetical protein
MTKKTKAVVEMSAQIKKRLEEKHKMKRQESTQQAVFLIQRRRTDWKLD